VVVTTETADGWCALDVEDSGPGIPAGSVRKIFDPFYRVPGVTAPGTGIGLATVHRIVEAHHGTVEVVSPPGAGARFRVRLPVRRAAASAALRSAER
jgi:signal transduction histidine kinase